MLDIKHTTNQNETEKSQRISEGHAVTFDKGASVENTSASESQDEKSRAEREKSFKTSQRSMRRSSATGSPNSLTSIPRYPAFDFSEQEDEQTLLTVTSEPEVNQSVKLSISESSKNVEDSEPVRKSPDLQLKDTNQKKRDVGKSKNLMPELIETSETESAKGSFEYEAPEYSIEPPPIPVPDTAFPNLPNSLLLKLGINKESSVAVESFNEQELENKFMTLALAFKTDKMTLAKRLEIQKRQRDNAEKNVENEIKNLKESINSLNLRTSNTETRDLITKIQTQVDILQQATSRISARSETYGAVQQEERVSRAFEVLMLHVDHLKRLFDREHKELEETKKMLTDTRVSYKEVNQGEGVVEDRKRSLKTFGIAVGSIKSVSRRRASVADFNHHSSLERCRTPPPLNRSWTSGFMVDTKSRLVNALSPFTVTSSIEQNRNSLSYPSSPVAKTLSDPSTPVNNSRRCSLPMGPLRFSPARNASKLTELNKETSPGLRTNDQKISIAPTLSSVTDEKEQSDCESDSEQLCTPPETPKNVENNNQNEYPSYDKDDETQENKMKENSEVLAVSSDCSDFECEENSDDGDDSLKQIGPNQTLLERFCSPAILHLWQKSSSVMLFRYSISVFLGFIAFMTLLLTILPCEVYSADSQNLHHVFDMLIHHIFDIRNTNRPV